MDDRLGASRNRNMADILLLVAYVWRECGISPDAVEFHSDKRMGGHKSAIFLRFVRKGSSQIPSTRLVSRGLRPINTDTVQLPGEVSLHIVSGHSFDL